MSDKKYIIIRREESVLQSWMRDASTFALCAGLIGLGNFIDSAAMQWIGAVIAFITILVKSSAVHKNYTFDIEGAQKRLDEIRQEDTQ